MQMSRIFLLIAILFVGCQSYCVSVADVIHENPRIVVHQEGGGIAREETILDLSRRNIDSLEGLDRVPGIERVTELKLSGNRLTQLNDHAFAMMPQLRVLNIKHNSIIAVGDNLFADEAAAHGIDIFLYGNPLSYRQVYKIMRQAHPNNTTGLCGALGWYLFRNCGERFNEKTDLSELTARGATIATVGASTYLALKLLCMHPRFAKANLVLDSLVHGANVARFVASAVRHPRNFSVDNGLLLAENGVHLHNTFRNPTTINSILQSRTGNNLNKFTTNPFVWCASWLPWARLLHAPAAAQDAMMAPWALCPSRASKLIEGARGAITIANWFWPPYPQLTAMARAVRRLVPARRAELGVEHPIQGEFQRDARFIAEVGEN